MDYVTGAHFSGLRIDGLLSSSPSAASSSGSAFSSSQPAENLPKQPFVIGASGGMASGKTTVCDMIIQQLHDHHVVCVNQDSFYCGLTSEESEHVHEYNFDQPDAFDTEQLLNCIEKLKSGQPYNVPIYDFKTHRRSSDSFRQACLAAVLLKLSMLLMLLF